MNRFSYALSVLAILAAGACAPSDGDDDDDGACEAALLSGDLVITELQADVAGVDDSKEWFEIYNGTNDTVSLVGLTLVHAKNDGTGESTHTMVSGEVPAGGYFVVAGILDEFTADYMDYGYGEDLGSLRNTNGLIALRCGTSEIDNIVYDAVEEDTSYTFDGGITPDHTANDIVSNWCGGKSSYGAGSELGTPQGANDPCGLVSTCNDGGTPREIVAPQAGDLVITEFMANPNATDVTDAEGEWFEVYVANAVDLNGVQVGKELGSTTTLNSPDCLEFAAGSYVLFARNDDPLINGGMDNVDFVVTTSLSNTDSSLVVAYADQLLDGVTWASVATGASTSLDPDSTNPTDNDDAGNFCDGAIAYGDGDLGTPGAPNDECLGGDECNDEGTIRPINSPTVNDLVITEFMANPNVVSDGNGEWFEVYVANAHDLNGLEIGKTDVAKTITSADCIEATAGTYLLFARDADTLVNGGLPAVDFTFSFGLTNGGDTLFVGLEGAVLDTITWTGSTAGASTQLDPDLIDPVANDTESNWCDGTTPYGPGDNDGTPAALNDVQCL